MSDLSPAILDILVGTARCNAESKGKTQWHIELYSALTELKRLRDEVPRLNAKISELEKNARRYQHLLENCRDHEEVDNPEPQLVWSDSDLTNWRERLSAAIDSNVPGNKA